MSAKKNKQKKPRNWNALDAIQRHAGPMKSKRREKEKKKTDLIQAYHEYVLHQIDQDYQDNVFECETTIEDTIPHGIYCYDNNGVCPYWRIDHNKPRQENGYCLYLSKGDWDLQCGLLWDQCKECSINIEEQEKE